MSPTGRRPCSYRPKLLCLAARVLLAPLLACSAGGVAAQEVLEFDIPAGKMSVALLRISQVAEVLLSFPPELVDQQTAPAVRGRFTLEQALSLALQSSGLVAEKLSTGTFVVRPVEPKATDAAGAAGTAAEDPPPASTGAPVAVLPRVVVNGLGLPRTDEGLRGLRGWSATRGDTPLAEVPQAVSVLTPQALELQGGTTSGEALGHVPGVTEILDLQGTTARFMPAYMVRGFAAANALSGMRTNRGAIPLDAVFLERIEVPKGPSGVVSGMAGLGSAFVSELGGTINMERKRAGPGTPAGIAQTLDSTDGGTLRFIGDVGGSWPGDTDWRIIGYASRSGRTDGGYDGKNSAGLLGSLQWGRGPFSAGLALQVDGSRNVPAPTSRGGLVRLPDNTLAIVPLEPGVATPLNPQDRLQARGADLDLELGWQLLPKWRVDLRGRLEEVRNEWTRTEILFKPLLSVPNSNRLHVMQVNLSGELATGAATHKIVLGLDAQRNQKQDTRFDATGAPLLTQITEQRQGVLLMDQISFGRWRLRLSAQRAAVSGLEAVVSDMPAEALGTRGTNGDVGLLYQLRPSTAIYAGLQSTVEAGNFTRAQLTLWDGSMRPPARMNQAQLGLKMELPDYRSTLSAEMFRIRKFNTTVQTKEGLALVPGRYVNGLELELSGRPHPSVDLSLGYSVMRARNVLYSGDTADMLLSTEGRTAGIPRRSLQLLARVRLPGQLLPDSSLGIGLRAASDMVVGIPGSQQGVGVRKSDYVLPGGGQLDVSLERLWGPWALKAFIRNLTDQQLYAPTYEVTYLPLRPARHFGLTITYKE